MKDSQITYWKPAPHGVVEERSDVLATSKVGLPRPTADGGVKLRLRSVTLIAPRLARHGLSQAALR